MSNLGKIYSVNLTKGVQEAYPVVYSNQMYYVCKQYGSHELHFFNKESLANKIYSIEQFAKEMQKETISTVSSENIYVYEPVHVHFNFKEYFTSATPLINRLKDDIANLKCTRKAWEDEKKKAECRVKDCQDRINTIDERIAKKEQDIKDIKQQGG